MNVTKRTVVVGLFVWSVLAMPAARSQTIPSAPTNLQAAAVSSVQINLTWSDTSTNENGFMVERSVDGTNFTQIAQVLPNTTTYRDLRAWPGTPYYYRVCAFNSAGNSAYTSAGSVAAPPLCPNTLIGWGDNSYGESTVPPGLTNVVAIAAGSGGDVLALKSDGTVVGWGYNYYGQATPPPGLSNVVAISANTHSLALKADGTVVGWGDNEEGEATPPAGLSNVVAIAAGGLHSIALKSDGTVVCWGYNYCGESTTPAGLSGVVEIAAANDSLALRSDGTVVEWGLGCGDPPPPTNLTGVIAISMKSQTLALKSDGTVVGWGWDPYGQADPPAGLTGVVAVAAADDHSLALKSDGTVVGWGENLFNDATPPAGLQAVTAIDGAGPFSLALTCAPTGPTNLVAVPIAPDQISLTWSNTSANQDEVLVEQAIDVSGSPGAWTQIATPGGAATNYTSQGLAVNAEYWYRVQGHNSYGDSIYSNETNAPTQPSAPANLSAIPSLYVSQVNLSWSNTAGYAAGFGIERALDNGGVPGTWGQIAVVDSNTASYSDTGVSESTTYWYRARSFNAAGYSPYSSLTSATTPFLPPAGLTATGVASNQINLAWINISHESTGIAIERAPNNGGTFTQIATVSSNVTAYSDIGLLPNTRYGYRVRAFNATQYSAYSGQAGGATLPLPPLAPTNLTATTRTGSQIDLSWADTNADATGYSIERALDAHGTPGTFSQITTVGSTITNYTDSGLTTNTTYWYRVRAYNTGGNSPYSNLANATTLMTYEESWISPMGGKWETGANWSTSLPPSVNFPSPLVTNAGSKIITIDAVTVSNYPGGLVISNLTVAGSLGATNALAISDAGTNIPLHVIKTFTMANGGAISITNSALQVDGTFGIDGTVALLPGGQITATNRLTCVGLTATGQVTMTGGTAVLGALVVASNAYSVGTFTMSGGSVVYSNAMFGVGSNSSASVWLSGGSFTSPNRNFPLTIGRFGSAQLTVSNGATLSAWITRIAAGNSSVGTLTVVGAHADVGDLMVGTSSNAMGVAWVSNSQLTATNSGLGVGGSFAIGQMTISNSTVLIGGPTNGTANVDVGASYGSTGTLKLFGGTLSSMGPQDYFLVGNVSSTGSAWINGTTVTLTNGPGYLALGVSGGGQLTVSNGSVTVGIFLDGYVGGSGTLTIAGGSVSVLSNSTVSYGGTGTVWVTGGQLLAPNGLFVLGNSNAALMAVSGGVAAIRNMIISSNNTANTSTLSVAGGQVTVFDSLVVGDCTSNAIGQITVNGGTLYVTNATHTGYLDVRGGTLTVSGSGRLVADVFVMTNTCGLFVNDGGSVSFGTTIFNANLSTVGDGIPDAWRAEYFPNVDPTGETTNNMSCATCDPDGDGQNNLQEYLAGTNPTNSASVLRIVSLAKVDGNVQVSFTSVSGKYYTLERCQSLGGAWATLVDNIPGTGIIRQATDIGGAGQSGAFYRIQLNQSPNLALVDSIGDGIPNAWRAQYFPNVDPTGATTNNLSCTTCDPDGTGFSNLQDYWVGVDPTNPAAAFRITSIVRTGNNLLATWTMGPGRTNALQATAGGANGGYDANNFTDIFTVTNTVGTTTNFLDLGGATNVPSRYYRVRVVP